LTALPDGSWQLYDIQEDRTEMQDLAGRKPKTVEALSKKWDAWALANQVTPLPVDYKVEYLRRH
jgi:arylsulfatase